MFSRPYMCSETIAETKTSEVYFSLWLLSKWGLNGICFWFLVSGFRVRRKYRQGLERCLACSFSFFAPCGLPFLGVHAYSSWCTSKMETKWRRYRYKIYNLLISHPVQAVTFRRSFQSWDLDWLCDRNMVFVSICIVFDGEDRREIGWIPE